MTWKQRDDERTRLKAELFEAQEKLLAALEQRKKEDAERWDGVVQEREARLADDGLDFCDKCSSDASLPSPTSARERPVTLAVIMQWTAYPVPKAQLATEIRQNCLRNTALQIHSFMLIVGKYVYLQATGKAKPIQRLFDDLSIPSSLYRDPRVVDAGEAMTLRAQVQHAVRRTVDESSPDVLCSHELHVAIDLDEGTGAAEYWALWHLFAAYHAVEPHANAATAKALASLPGLQPATTFKKVILCV
eukprot:gene6114-9388_t